MLFQSFHKNPTQNPIRKKIVVCTVIVQFNKAASTCYSVVLTLHILSRWRRKLVWKRDRKEMQHEKRPEFNCNKTGCPDVSAIAGSLFILPSATVENTYRDWQPEWLTTNTTLFWGQKCVFYQAESSAKTQRVCVKWTNNEAKKGAKNFSLC